MIDALETRLLLSVGLLTTDQDIGCAGPGRVGGLFQWLIHHCRRWHRRRWNSDQFNFAYETYFGNVMLVTQVSSLPNMGTPAQAGLMIRNDVSVGSALVGVFVTPASGIELITRTTDGGAASQTTIGSIPPPEYLELTLSGSTVTAYYSSNGTTWTQLGSSQHDYPWRQRPFRIGGRFRQCRSARRRRVFPI